MEKFGHELLNDPFLNKSTAFSLEERKRYQITGLLPPVVENIHQQATRLYKHYLLKNSLIERRRFLMEIFDTNRTLFYHLFQEHLVELMPVVYDPVIAENIKNYSELFIDGQYACFLPITQPHTIKTRLQEAAGQRNIRLIVVTDAEEILGIGDWGTNGVDIAVGKLMVYTAAAGIDPSTVLPIVLDVGTNNQNLLADPLYLGLKQPRVKGQAYYDFLHQFVTEVEELFPQVYLHFEDFGRDNATTLLEKYSKQYLVFNDDVQGTGIITLAGILGALKIAKEDLTQQRYLCFGAGTAGMGIVNVVYQEMLHQGLSPAAAKAKFFIMDKQGLLFTNTPDLTKEQAPFALDYQAADPNINYRNLLEVVKAIKPTILVGTSTCPQQFTKEIVETMLSYCSRPIIFPLSNPTELAEAKAEDLITWSKGQALVATGIPVDPIDYNGITYNIGQANNALVYPGLGLGVLACQAKRVSPKMISAAAHSLVGLIDATVPGAAVLPPVAQLQQFSNNVATAVIETANQEKLNTINLTNIPASLKAFRWEPIY